MKGKMFRKPRRLRAMTLVEVMATVVVVSSAGISILAGINYGIFAQRDIHEENGAVRIAAEIIEEQKRKLFKDLESFALQPDEAREAGYVIYDNGTANQDDDILGRIELRFFDTHGSLVGTEGVPVPLDGSKVTAQVTVTWDSAVSRDQELIISTIMAP